MNIIAVTLSQMRFIINNIISLTSVHILDDFTPKAGGRSPILFHFKYQFHWSVLMIRSNICWAHTVKVQKAQQTVCHEFFLSLVLISSVLLNLTNGFSIRVIPSAARHRPSWKFGMIGNVGVYYKLYYLYHDCIKQPKILSMIFIPLLYIFVISIWIYTM